MLHFRQAIIYADGQVFDLIPGKYNSFDAFYVDFQQVTEKNKEDWSLFIHPKQDIKLEKIEIKFTFPKISHQFLNVLVNGFQSHSATQWLPATASMPRLNRLARARYGFSGDEHIADIPHTKGELHSWSFMGVQPDGGGADGIYLHSTNEKTGFTLFIYDQTNGILTVRKDLRQTAQWAKNLTGADDALHLSHSFPALYFTAEPLYRIIQSQPPQHAFALFGPLSAIPQSTDLAIQPEGILVKDASTFNRTATGGSTAKIGDWLAPSFANGIAQAAREMRVNSMLPNLWLAPFIVASDAEITRRNPDWLLRDRLGQPIRAGWRPEWGGWLHVLDFYNPGVRDYLSGVFHVAVEQWQIAWLQLDYLYAVCLAPPPDKTRGQVLHEALEFLQSLCGTAKMALNRVPLGSAMPIAAACRISNDADTTWTDRRANYLHYRERTGALEALRSLISRWHFCKMESGVDTGAFSLALGADKLSPVQQNTVLTINMLLGNYISTTDAIQTYTPEQATELLSVLDLRGSRVVSINMVQPDVFQLVFEQSKIKGVAWCNLNKRAVQVLRTQSEWLELNAFETIILY